MVEPKEDGQQHGERDGEEDIADANVPEMDEPATVSRREECLAGRKSCDMDIFHVAEMHKPGEEDDRQWSAIVLDEFPHVSLEKIAFAENATTISKPQYQQTHHDREICTLGSGQFPLSRQDLDPLL